jgi:hypothetical protein
MADQQLSFSAWLTMAKSVLCGRSDMEIDTETWNDLSASLCSHDLIAPSFLKSSGWSAVIFDDNPFNFSALEAELSKIGIRKYYSVPIVDLGKPVKERRILKMTVGKQEWKLFLSLTLMGMQHFWKTAFSSLLHLNF